MRLPLASIVTSVAVVTAFAGRSVAQGGAGGDAGTDPAATEPAPAPLPDGPDDPSAGDAMPAAPAVRSPSDTRYGAGLRLRSVHIPKALIELFVEQAGTSVSGVGVGLELYRRKGDFELQVGFEYENLNGSDGIWVDKGDMPGPPPGGDEVDFVEFDRFGWFSVEVTFINHTRLAKMISLRYGGGAGIAILKGDIVRTDYACSVSTLDPDTLRSSCMRKLNPENDQTPYDLPPVFPIINAIFGVQIRPIDNLVINLEAGIRTIPFFGGTVGYYF